MYRFGRSDEEVSKVRFYMEKLEKISEKKHPSSANLMEIADSSLQNLSTNGVCYLSVLDESEWVFRELLPMS